MDRLLSTNEEEAETSSAEQACSKLDHYLSVAITGIIISLRCTFYCIN